MYWGDKCALDMGTPEGQGSGIPGETKGDTPVWTILPAPVAPGHQAEKGNEPEG